MRVITFRFVCAVVCLTVLGCNKKLEDAELEQTTQAAMDDFSSIDEAFAGTARSEDAQPPSRGGFCFQKQFTGCTGTPKTRTRDFDNCTRALTGTVWNGTVNLEFSGSGCNIQHSGDSVTRTSSNGLTITSGSTVISVTTGSTTTHDGVVLSGGQKLTRTGTSAFQFDVLGINRKTVSGGTEISNVSRKTTSPLTITGSTRGERVVTGGKIVAYHNLGKFNVEWVPENVTWDTTCLCPISGSMTGTFSGARSGTTTVKFSGCGSANIEREGKSLSLDLDSCETSS